MAWHASCAWLLPRPAMMLPLRPSCYGRSTAHREAPGAGLGWCTQVSPPLAKARGRMGPTAGAPQAATAPMDLLRYPRRLQPTRSEAGGVVGR